jgi:hypothetical protein
MCIPELTYCIKEGRPNVDCFKRDAWLLPLYSSCRQHWLLGVIDWRRNRLWYVDSQPRHSTVMKDQGDCWTWMVRTNHCCLFQCLSNAQILTRLIVVVSTFLGHHTNMSRWCSCMATVRTVVVIALHSAYSIHLSMQTARSGRPTVAFGCWLTLRHGFLAKLVVRVEWILKLIDG